MSDKPNEAIENLSFKCPSCETGLIELHKIVYDIPDGDKMLIIKFECNNCDFTQNDVIPLTTRLDPGILTLRVTDEKDLRSKVYRSPTAKLEIPELELMVNPGPNADFYYTNVEGILLRFENAVTIYKNNMEDEDPQKLEINEILNDLAKAIKGQFKFTLKIIDPGGGSYIIPHDESKYKFERLNPKENT